MKTLIPSGVNIPRNWHVIDAENVVLGRLASKAANILMGKHKPVYTPYIDMGDHVIVVNAEKVKLTGAKEEQKIYRNHSGYPGGLREVQARKVRATRPVRMVEDAVQGMLEEQAGQTDVPEAAGLRGSEAPARRTEARGSGGWPLKGEDIRGSIGATFRNWPPQACGGSCFASGRRQDHGERARVRKLFSERGVAGDFEAAAAGDRDSRQVRHPDHGAWRRSFGTGRRGEVGYARALLEFNNELRGKLKELGFLTRDAREHERKKYGQKGARSVPVLEALVGLLVE